MCVIPGVIMTLKDEAGLDFNNMMTCVFPDKNLKALDPKAQADTTISNISDIFKQHEDRSISTAAVNQTISITGGPSVDDMDNPYFRSKQQCKRPGLAGLLGMTIEQPQFGCFPDLTQKIDMEMSEIKESLVEEYEEITQQIVSDMSLKATGGKPVDSSTTDDQKDANKFIQDQIDETEEYVKDLLDKLRVKYSQKDQNTLINDYPLPFGCDCNRKGPAVNQETKFKMFSQEIYEAVRKRIIDKSIEAGMDIELEGESSGPGVGRQLLCFFQILASTASVLAIFWLVYSIATNKDIIEEDKANAARPGIIGSVVKSKLKMKEQKEGDKLEAGKEKRKEDKEIRKEDRQDKREQGKKETGEERAKKERERGKKMEEEHARNQKQRDASAAADRKADAAAEARAAKAASTPQGP